MPFGFTAPKMPFGDKKAEAPKPPAPTPAPTAPGPTADGPTAPAPPWTTGRLSVEILGARGLRAADKSGMSDPFVCVQLVNAGKALPKPHHKPHKTRTVKKTLAPRYKDETFVVDACPLETVRFQVYDWNAGLMGMGSGKAKPLGEVSVDLAARWAAQPAAGPDGRGISEWLKLDALEGQQGAGEVEVKILLTPGTGDAQQDAEKAAEAARWFVDEQEVEKGEPNVLHVAVIRARGLKAADKSLMGASSSDPFVTLEFVDKKTTVKTDVVKKSLEPIWMKLFELPVPVQGKKLGPLPSLDVLVQDHDTLSSDFLGKVSITPSSLPELEKDGAAPPTWYPLQNKDGSPSADRGQVQLALKLVYDAQHDPSEDRPFFAEEVPEEFVDKPPNELRIAIARARDLKAMDAAIPFSSRGKTSDPYVSIKIAGFSEKKTKTKMKTLAPVWNDDTFAFDLVSGQHGASTESVPKDIELTVMDYDVVGSDDFLGVARVTLADLLEAKHKPVQRWYPLGDTAQASGDGSRGSLLVVAQWRYNRDLDFAPLAIEDDVVDHPPNEIKVALFRGRGLAVKDKHLLSKGGTSDPRVRFELLGGAFSDDASERRKQEAERRFTSSVRKKTLDPVWREVFARELRKPQDTTQGTWSPPALRCICEDVDQVGAADFMGCVDIELSQLLEDRSPLSGWHALGPDPDGTLSANVSGEIHVSVQWRHDPALDFDPWVNEEGSDKPPNELRVALAKGRDLSVKDKPVLWGEGTSDPRVTFSLSVLGNDKAPTPLTPWSSLPKKKTLHPTWNETFAHPLPPPEEGQPGWVLTCTCEDVDDLSSTDFMGRAQIELNSVLGADTRRSRGWHALASRDGGSSNVTGELDVIVQWRYNPALDFDPWLHEAKDPAHADRDPNELRIALVQGRNLAVKDKAVLYGGGSSDPRVTFKITGTKYLTRTSKTIRKSLDPSYREIFSLPLTKDYAEDENKIDFGTNGPILEVTCEDVDDLSSADFMGELNLPVNAMRERTRKWYPLQADAEGKHKSSNVVGEVELIVEWCYNPLLDFDPFLEEDLHPDKKPNEVRVALGRGRNLAVKDKTVLYGEGSSDPRCTLSIAHTELREVSQVQKKTLNPIWNEAFAFPYSRGPDQPPELIIECEDVDALSASDFMGLVRFELDALQNHARWHGYKPLQAKTAGSSNVSGDLEVFVQWRYNAALDFDPFPVDDVLETYEAKAPNELRIALVQARGLAIKDKNLLSKGGSSDPFASFEVAGATFKSATKYKTLNPRWNQLFQVPLKDAEKPRLDVVLYDEDEVTSPDFMGRVSVALDAQDKRPQRAWHTLLPEEGKSDDVKGAVELIIQWWYNPALDFEPFLEVDEYANDPPNELRVALISARDLAVKDKNLLSKGGTSDPRCTLSVTGTDLTNKSTTKPKTLVPLWNEVFSFPYDPGSAHENPPVLDVLVEDVDALSKADFMGRVKVELAPLKNKRLRRWFSLVSEEGASSNVTGDVELVVQWRHNPYLAYAPFDDSVEVPAGKKPNELRVAAISARRLAVKDKKLIGEGSSDPVVTFELGSVTAETTVKKKTLNPTWKEAFAKPCSVEEAGDCHIKVKVEDWDAVGGRDFMGSCTIDLKERVEAPNRPAVRTWCLLDLDEAQKTQTVSGEVEIWYQWRYNPLLDFDPFTEVASDKPPNVLRVGLARGRGLRIMDKNVLSTGGSSDPRCVLSLVGKDGAARGKPMTSAHQTKTLAPTWREVHDFDCEDGTLSFKCVVEDRDEVSSADYMGEVSIKLGDLAPQKVLRQWHTLHDPAGKRKVEGEVELILQWCYDADRDFEAFPEIDESGKAPNELCVGVFRARNLAVKDKAIIVGKGSSDPYVKVKVAGTTLERRTKVKTSTLEPVWKELFIVPFSSERPDKDPPQLEVSCWDRDAVSGDDAMGTATLDLAKWKDRERRTGEKVWLPLEGAGAAGDVCVVVCWRHSAARAFAPFEAETVPEGKQSNELRIGLFQATGLAVKDPALVWGAGSSDPRVTFSVGALNCTSHTVKQSLDPAWKEVMTLELPRGPAGTLVLEGLCEDVDEVSGADFMGQFTVDLAECVDGRVKRLWRSLEPRTEKDVVSGDVELVLQWRYNPRLDFCPFDGFVDEHVNEPPNELRIALIRAQGLAIADKNLLSKGGSSDPRCTFVLTGVDDPWKSHTIKKCLDPKWKEQFVRLLDVPGDGSAPSLTVTCEDVDEVSGADFMGQFTVDLGPLADHKPVRQWYPLQEAEGRKGDVAGHVELFLQWVYNPVTAFDPFAPSETEGEPNELRIGLGRARDLPAMDKALVLGKSSSDPRCTFTVAGTAVKLQSSTKKSTLTPTWKETFEAPLPKGPPETAWQLVVDVEDWDRVSAADFMGRVTVDLDPLVDQTIVKGSYLRWYPLQTKEGAAAQGEVYLVLQWRRNRDLVFEPFQDEEEFAAKEPNSLQIAAVAALGLAVADKNVLSAGGSSDPFLTFTLEGSALKPFKTKVKAKSLDPVWNEQFARSVTPAKKPLALACTCEDWDEVSGSDFMGRFSVDLESLRDQKVLKKWLKLGEAEGRKGDVAGHVLLHVQWRHDPALAFEPFSEDTSDKTPNELRIGIFKARDLVVADTNLLSKGGSSDPRVKLSIAGSTWTASSKIVKKSLEPVWKETFVVPLPHIDLDGWATPTLSLEVEDWDEISSADAMGRVSIPLTPDHAISREWYSLVQTDKGLLKEVSGEVNVVLQWRYSPDLDYDPMNEPVEYPDEEPNELRLAVVQARGLAIMDKNLLSKGGSSDPFVEVSLSSAKKAKKTAVKKKTLEPVFREQFQWSVSPSSSDTQPSLTFNVQDWDAVSSNDPMGSVAVDLATLLERKGAPLRKWYALDTGGAVEIIVQWRHSPSNAWKPFAAPKFPDKAPNELRLGLSQGRELAVKDKNLLSKGGSSDPYCKFSLVGTNVTFCSTVQQKSVDPVWREIFTQPMPDLKPLPKLQVDCFDRDAMSKEDSMGSFVVDLAELRSQAVSKKWYALDEGEVELVLQWYHDPALAYDPFEAVESTKAPNELCVAVSQGRNLVIKDSNIFSSGGTSDPRCILNVVGGSSVKLSHTTETLTKTLNPRWREVWRMPLTANGGETLHCCVEDVDRISAADFMGATAGIDLSQLKPNTITRKWYSLQTEDPLTQKKCKGEVHGDVELIVLWRYNESLDWDPFERDTVSEGPVNELRVAAFRGRKLAIRDKNLFSAGGSSDPKLTFALSTSGEASHAFKTKAQKTTLDPTWKEQFCFPLKPDDCGGTCVLQVKCEDADTISANDAMGSVSIDLWGLQGKYEQKWYALTGEGAEGAVELIVQWRHDPTKHEAELDARARREAKAAEDAKRKALEAERAAAEEERLSDEAERKKQMLEDAERRRKERNDAERRRRAEEEARLKVLAEEKEKKRLEDEARRKEESERARKAREAATAKRAKAEAERKQQQALADEENRRKLAEQKARDDAAAARRREAARKRRMELEEAARLRKGEEAARRDAARSARAEADAKRAAAEARRRDEARARLRDEAEKRGKREAAARARRREAALKLKADEDARLAADEAYREGLRMSRTEALSKATIERQQREAKEDLKREKELAKALGDGSCNWRPGASSRYGSKPDTHVFPSKTAAD